MAFPGTLDIQYYRGDTYEFKIYPKDASGAAYSLADQTAVFTIADARGDGATQIPAYAQVSSDLTHVLCAITPTASESMPGGVDYVYDVEISKAGSPYASVITLLTGNIFVTEQVTGATA